MDIELYQLIQQVADATRQPHILQNFEPSGSSALHFRQIILFSFNLFRITHDDAHSVDDKRNTGDDYQAQEYRKQRKL